MLQRAISRKLGGRAFSTTRAAFPFSVGRGEDQRGFSVRCQRLRAFFFVERR